MLKRPALGQVAPLGTLYDARSDSFVGISIFKENLSKEAIKLTQTGTTNVKIRRSDTYKEKFKHMDMGAGLSASFLAGLVDVEGSGKFLKDKARGSRFTQVSLYYDINTVEESLNVSSMQDRLQFDRFKPEYATHLVTGITWGAKYVINSRRASPIKSVQKVRTISPKFNFEVMVLAPQKKSWMLQICHTLQG